MDRRGALVSTGVLALSAFAVAQRSSAEDSHPDETHTEKYRALAHACGVCVAKAQICVDDCLDMLGTNADPEMATCVKGMLQMIALCTALEVHAAQHSRYVPALAKVASDACKDCAAMCKKFADKRESCAACMAACKACAKECEKFAS